MEEIDIYAESNTVYQPESISQEYISDTITPIVVREEVVISCCNDVDAEMEFVELQPTGCLSGSAEQNHGDMDVDIGPSVHNQGVAVPGPPEQNHETMDIQPGPSGQTQTHDFARIKKAIEDLSSDESSANSQEIDDSVRFHYPDKSTAGPIFPKVEINSKMYSITRASKKGNLSLRCCASHKKIKG